MLSFNLSSKDFKAIRYCYLKDSHLLAGQTAIRLKEGRPFIIINPPTKTGYYKLSIRELKDGRRLAIVGDSHD